MFLFPICNIKKHLIYNRYLFSPIEMIKEIKRISEGIIERNTTPNYIDFNKIKTEIRDELSKYLYEETECKPMIIAVVQEV